MLEFFCKNSAKQENIRNSRLKKRLQSLYQKENFKPEIKPLINNWQDKLYSLESKQARGAKIRANIRWDLEGEKCSKSFFKIFNYINITYRWQKIQIFWQPWRNT